MRRAGALVDGACRRRGGTDRTRGDWGRSGRGRGPRRCRRSATGSLGMTATSGSVLVVWMVGQMLDPQSFCLLDERPLGGQRQLAPVVSCSQTRVYCNVYKLNSSERCLLHSFVVRPIPWGHSGPLCHALSLLSSSCRGHRCAGGARQYH